MLQGRAQILILLLLLRYHLLLVDLIIVVPLGGCASYRDRVASRGQDISLLDLASAAHDTLLGVVQALDSVLRGPRRHEFESICESATSLLGAPLGDSCLGKHALAFLVVVVLARSHSVVVMVVLMMID